MDKESVINETVQYVKKALEGEGSGHDWWHVYRVWKNAIHISQKEEVDSFVVELVALLHDIADYKFHDGDDSVGPRVAREWLESQNVEEETINKVTKIIEEVSFKGANVKEKLTSKESGVVRDADKLDAIGAIGMARAFAYGGKVERPLYDPNTPPKKHDSFEDYKKHGNTSSINHFYEKLLLLKSLMNTQTKRNC